MFATAVASKRTTAVAALAALTYQAPQFQADVDRVRVDVIVTDEEGRFVDDLSADDFVLREDGVPQQLLSVQLVDVGHSRTAPTGTPPEVKVEEAGATAPPASGAAPGSDAVDAVAGQVIMLIDLVGLGGAKLRFSAYFEHWLEDRKSLPVPWAVFLLTEDNNLYELAPLGRDTAPLLDAIRWLRGLRWLRGAPIEPMLNDDAVRNEQLADIADVGPSFAVPRFAAHLAARRGRTALVWVTTRQTGTFFGREIYRAANSANVSIYTLDPSLRQVGNVPIASATATFSPQYLAGRGGGIVSAIDIANRSAFARRAARRDIAQSLREASEATGGRLFTNWMDFDGVAATIQGETGRYYLLTYAPPPPAGDGRYHEIDITVRRPQVTVRARHGYTDYPAGQRGTGLTSAFRTLSRVGDHITLGGSTAVIWTPDRERLVVLTTAVDPAQLRVLEGPAGRGVTLGLRAVIFDHDNEPLVDMADMVEGRPALGIDAPHTAPLVHRTVWRPESTARGSYHLEVVGVDQASNRSGRLRLAFELADAPPGDWHAATPVLVESTPESGLVPAVLPEPGTTLAVLVQVLGGSRPTASALVSAAATASRPARHPPVKLPAVTLTRRGQIHQGVLVLPGDLALGEYSVDVSIEDEPVGGKHTERLALAISRS